MTVPARKIKRSAVKNIVRFPAIKANGGETILVESILESNYCLHLEFCDSVKLYKPQPRTFTVSGEHEEFVYTPDFEVVLTSEKVRYDEVKPSSKAENPLYQNRFLFFQQFLSSTEASFNIVTEKEICREPLLSNYKKLYRYRKSSSHIDIRKLRMCSMRIRQRLPLATFIRECEGFASLKEIYQWLAWGHLKFDIENQCLNSKTEVGFHDL